ncbi:MAG: DcrB-related protein [Bryobacteraceae bacterium]|nr:DcrB-related protein [Bryobacteraceae bacterium]
MHSIAGDLRIELPAGWIDSSEYLYLSADEELSLKLTRLTVSKEVLPGQLRDDRKQRLQALGQLTETATGETTVDGWPAAFCSLEIAGTDNNEKQLARLLVVKVSPTRAVVAVMTGPPARQRELVAAWTAFQSNFALQRNE